MLFGDSSVQSIYVFAFLLKLLMYKSCGRELGSELSLSTPLACVPTRWESLRR